MPDALLETKLLQPRSRSRTVARPRLDELMVLGAGATVVLVSAPAGFGKTTLLATWLAHEGGSRPTAWVSLDEGDRDATSFWTYLLLAVDRAAPGTASAALGQLRTGQVAVETVLASLLNELSVLPGDLNVVLDDYHLAETPEIQGGMAFLVEHLPPQVHLVISSRVDPALPLARLRARGELVEIRAADLRFTEVETSAYLNGVNDLGLSPTDVATLEDRTEGWAAALQLAALSLQGREDRATFIAGFAGDDRFVVDYLADEVLDRQPPDVRRFLLDTSVLDRLTGPLCDAVTGTSGGRAMLESLERQNLFVVPLDDHRRWYRYHHLFADVVQSHLLNERPDDRVVLHRRASTWYDRAGDPEGAVRHALAAGAVDLAAAQIEVAMPALRKERREAVICRWADELPADVVANRPVLAVGFIGALSASNQFSGIEQRLDDVEHLLANPPEGQVVVDTAELGRLPAQVQTYRAALALVGGDPGATVAHAERALQLADSGDHLTTASASALIGLAAWAYGELAAAHHHYLVAAENLERAGHVADVLGCTITLVDLEIAQGHLREARLRCHHALELSARDGGRPRGTADVHVALSRVSWEQGRLADVADQLRRADELGESAGLPQHAYRWRVAMAHLREAEGDVETAIGLLEEAERVYVGDFSPNVRPVSAERVRVLVASGAVDQGLAWARTRDLSADDDLAYLHEYEHITLARVLLADHTATGDEKPLAEAVALLDRLLAAAEAGARTGVVIEVLVLRALASWAAGAKDPALRLLERAVRLAEPHGYVRVFTAEGSRLAEVLATLAARHRDWAYLQTLLGAMVATTHRSVRSSGPSSAAGEGVGDAGGGSPGQQALVDPLSRRELDVLRYLASDLDGPAIARALGVSLSTVRTHTQHVYTKLAVTNRRAAVRRAHQLNLFARTDPHGEAARRGSPRPAP